MQIEAKVSHDGVVTAQLPDRYRDRKVRVIVEDEDERLSPQWARLAEILDRAETLTITRRSHQQILDDLRGFRESTDPHFRSLTTIAPELIALPGG